MWWLRSCSNIQNTPYQMDKFTGAVQSFAFNTSNSWTLETNLVIFILTIKSAKTDSKTSINVQELTAVWKYQQRSFSTKNHAGNISFLRLYTLYNPMDIVSGPVKPLSIKPIKQGNPWMDNDSALKKVLLLEVLKCYHYAKVN